MSVRSIGRLHFLVQSCSRADVEHVVDFEPNEYGAAPACSCEDSRMRLRECRHVRAVREFLTAAGRG